MAAHSTTLILVSFLFFSQLSIAFSADKFRCHPNDYKALMKIKQALGNPGLLASWKPNIDCCHWYFVRCGLTSNRVTDLFIGGNPDYGFSGQIPPAVGDLPYLTHLSFHKLPNLTSPIPESITKLKNLSFLSLSWTGLSGPIPEFLTELTNLDYLELSFNQFSGSIPSSFSKFTKLRELYLDRNRLTGSIPESFGHFTVRTLYLSHNQLTGPIPKSFANIDFGTIDLSRNKLTGDASMLFKPKGSMEILDISRNMLEFDFSKVKFPRKSLTWLDLNHNKIYGNIPKDIVKLSLQSLNVSYNRLCGQIPTGGDFRSFDYSAYIHNKCLCGPPLSNKCK